jgi:two-component system, chemotaxis family, chemotaxis protein CheY
MRRMVSHTLGRAGFATIEAGSGAEGLQKLQDSGQGTPAVDLIITDLNMPEMNGIEFIRQLRTLESTRFTPVLMLTTESHEETRQKGKEAGATGWITKPFNPEKLVQVIGRLLP